MPGYLSMRLNNKETTTLKYFYETDSACTWHTYPVFSGASGHKNNPESTAIKNVGPLPKGRYYVVDRPKGGVKDSIRDNIWDFDGKGEWFALFRKDGNINDYTTIDGVRRGNFRLHPGSRSAGCVTFVHKKHFNEVRKMLKAETTATIPGGSVPYYAILIVE